MLKVENLKTEFIGPATFEIEAGQCIALMGPSGSGKSLLLRAIADLDVNQGSVVYNRQARNEMPAHLWRRILALVPAESGWWADRVGDHFPDDAAVAEQIGDVGLPGALDWQVSRLSTGERQRLAIVRAVCRDPQAIMLDEPTSSLDDEATRMIENLIQRICRDGKLVLLVTHDAHQASRLASRTLAMCDGQLTGAGEPCA